MNNLNKYGRRYIGKYLRNYSIGLLSFNEIKAILNCCFKDRLRGDV